MQQYPKGPPGINQRIFLGPQTSREDSKNRPPIPDLLLIHGYYSRRMEKHVTPRQGEMKCHLFR